MVRALGWSLSFYGRYFLLLLGLSVVPTAFRVVAAVEGEQLSQDLLHLFELPVGLFRLALNLVIVALALVDGEAISPWTSYFVPSSWFPRLKQVLAWLKTHWLLSLWQIAVLSFIQFAFSGFVSWLVSEPILREIGIAGSSASAISATLDFSLRNLIILPIYTVSLVSAFRPVILRAPLSQETA